MTPIKGVTQTNWHYILSGPFMALSTSSLFDFGTDDLEQALTDIPIVINFKEI